MVELPTEVWLHVAQFLPASTKKKLIGLSSVFFDIGMDLRWKSVLVDSRHPDRALQVMERVSDPLVAKRVEKLTFRLTHVKLPSQPSSPEIPRSPYRRQKKHVQEYLYRIMKPFSKYFGTEKQDTFTKEHKPQQATFYELMREFIALTPKLTHIKEFSIDSWDLPPAYDLQPLYTSIWNSFGPSLRVFSFGANLGGFRTLVSSSPELSSLIKLDIEIANDIYQLDRAGDRDVPVKYIAPFINSLRGQLKSLRFCSWADTDWSSCFDTFAPSFPFLEQLSIRLNYNTAFVQSVQGFHNFLGNISPNLREVELRLKPTGIIANPALETRLSDWLNESFVDPTFLCNLTVIDIYVTHMEAGMEVAHQCIQRTAPRLRQFVLRDRYLHLWETKELLSRLSACPNLEYLRLSLWKIEIELLDYMAEKVPGITKLWLSIGQSISNSNPNDLGYPFFQELKARSYAGWNLRDLNLWQGGQEVDHTTMCLFADRMPSLNSFFGNGHTDVVDIRDIHN